MMSPVYICMTGCLWHVCVTELFGFFHCSVTWCISVCISCIRSMLLWVKLRRKSPFASSAHWRSSKRCFSLKCSVVRQQVFERLDTLRYCLSKTTCSKFKLCYYMINFWVRGTVNSLLNCKLYRAKLIAQISPNWGNPLNNVSISWYSELLNLQSLAG